MCRKSFSPSEVIPYCVLHVLLLLFLFLLVPQIGKYVIHLLVIQLQCLSMVTSFLMLFKIMFPSAAKLLYFTAYPHALKHFGDSFKSSITVF